MKVGITGHRTLRDTDSWNWVRRELRLFLAKLPPPLIGVTSLAVGADQLFAEVVLESGGQIEAVIPFVGYEQTFDAEPDLRNYLYLKNKASHVEVLAAAASAGESYLRAGKRIVDSCDCLVAVWDGHPAQGLGGTADIVNYAILIGKPIIQFNPINRQVISRGRIADESQ